MELRLSKQEIIGLMMEYGDKSAYRIGRMSSIFDSTKGKEKREKLRQAIIEQIRAINDIRAFLEIPPLVIDGFETIMLT